jgi:transcriptional regulator with XRE-family HTH domain
MPKVISAEAVRVGAAIRGARCAARMTQADLGALCGYSGSAVSRIESGELQPGWEVLARILDLLGVPRSIVEGHPTGGSTRPVGVGSLPEMPGRTRLSGRAEPREDAVRRRELIAGAVGAGAALALGAGAGRAQAAPDPQDAIERALFQPQTAAPMSLPDLGAALGRARADFRAARYAALGDKLPGLLAGAHATRDAARGIALEQAEAALARAYVLAAELAVKYHQGAAWAAADRSLTAARASGDPVVLGESARLLAITMRRAGRARGATVFLARTAQDLDGQSGDEALAVRASLLMTAAYSAAQARDRSTAEALMDEAETATARVPQDRALPLFTVDASPAQADLYRIGVATVLGVPERGVKYAGRIDARRLPTRERRARYYTDTARMWHALGEDRRAFGALRAVEHVAPEEVRRPGLRALTQDLAYGPIGGMPQVVAFAQRTGALQGA